MTDDPKPDSEEIIQRVLGPYLDGGDPAHVIRRGSRRCVLLLDNSTAVLAAALKDANFWAVRVPTGMSLAAFETRDLALSGRILVTSDTEAYIDDAPVLDYGIIGLDALGVMHAGEGYADNTTVKMLSRAVTRHRLASRSPAGVIMLVPEGEHVVVGLE